MRKAVGRGAGMSKSPAASCRAPKAFRKYQHAIGGCLAAAKQRSCAYAARFAVVASLPGMFRSEWMGGIFGGGSTGAGLGGSINMTATIAGVWRWDDVQVTETDPGTGNTLGITGTMFKYSLTGP
jgi:hypothetical protein